MLKKAIHHIRHTRPQWYQEYHRWQYHGILHWATFVVSSLVILMGFVNVLSHMLHISPVGRASADDSTTVVTQVVNTNPAGLTISNTGDETLSAATYSITHQETTGDLGTITLTDNRGTGAGWTATAQSTDFYKYNTPSQVSPTSKTLILGTSTPYATSSADVDMNSSDIYTITIGDIGGDPTTATFDVSGAATADEQLTGANVAVGSKGLKVNFNDTGYTTGESWTVRVDTIPVTGFIVDANANGDLTVVTGETTGMTATSDQFFTDGDFNDSFIASLVTMNPSLGYGMGSYTIHPNLTLGIPGNSYAVTYTATVTETIQ